MLGAPEFLDPQTWHTQVKDGQDGALETVDYIRNLIFEGVSDFLVREEAMGAIQHVPDRDTTGIIRAIHGHVQRNYRFRWDPYGREMLVNVRYIILGNRRTPGFGIDCDDFVILESSLLRSVGIPTDIVVSACDKQRPHDFSHIYLRAYDRKLNKWIPLDPTNKRAAPGWEPKSYLKRVINIDLARPGTPEVPVPSVSGVSAAPRYNRPGFAGMRGRR